MKPADSLLSRARAYLKNRTGRTALAVAPLATLGLAANSAQALDSATFDPAAAFTYGNDSNNLFSYNASGGALRGTSLGTNSDGITGATFDTGTGGVVFQDFNGSEGGNAGTVGSIQIFDISGTGTGSFNPTFGQAQIHYDFTIDGSPGFSAISPGMHPNDLNPIGVSVTGGTLALTVVTTTGTFSQNVTLDASSTYTGDVTFAVSGNLLTYSAILTANYLIGADGGNFDTITTTVPAAQSIDFNAVPEPSTWLILATGVAGTGLRLMRVRQRRAKAV